MTTVAAPSDPMIRYVDPSTLVDSPTNPRGPYDKETWDLSDLVVQGVKVVAELGILCRPRPGKFGPLMTPKGEDIPEHLEVVWGHRRKWAAIELGADQVKVEVLDMADDEVLAAQWAENAAREDVHPLHQARHLESMAAAGATHQDLADNTGRSLSWVSKRLVLCKLTKKSQAAFIRGSFSAAIAMLLARIPNANLQNKALNLVVGMKTRTGDLISTGEARELLKRKFMLDLKEAQFSVTADDPKIGACSSCPKRAKNQAVLFDDFDGQDLCSDPVCFRAKQNAHWKAMKAKAKKIGQKVMPKKESANLFDNWNDGLCWKAKKKFRDLDSPEWSGSSSVKLRAVLKKAGDLPEITLAQSPAGRVVELVSRSAVDKLLRRTSSTGSGSPKLTDAEKKRRAKEKRAATIEKATRAAAMLKIGSKLRSRKEAPRVFWDMVLNAVNSWDHAAEALGRRGVSSEKGRAYGALVDYAKKIPADQVKALVFELVVSAKDVPNACKALGIDLKKIRKQEAAAVDAAAQPPKEKVAKKKPRKKASKPRVKKKAARQATVSK